MIDGRSRPRRSSTTSPSCATSLLKVPNVKAVVPMGISGALVTSGNTIDLALAKLRDAVQARAREPGPTPSARAADAPGRRARRATSARSSRCCRTTSRTPRRCWTSAPSTRTTSPRSRAPPPTQFWTELRHGPARRAGVPREPDRAARRPTPTCCSCATSAPTSTAFAAVVRPHEDRRRDGGPARQARLPVLQVHLRGAAQAEDRAPAGQDQGRRSRPQGETIATDPGAAALRAREQLAGARDPAPARRAQDRRRSAPSCSRSSGSKEDRRRQAAGRVLPDRRQQLRTRATTSSTRSWRRRWSCTACASATSLTIKAFTRTRLRAVGQRARSTAPSSSRASRSRRWPARST